MSDRYDDIMRRIAARKAQPPPQTDALTLALDRLNALDALAKWHPDERIVYGPAAFRGQLESGERWVGALIWHRPKDYHGYKAMVVLGIWAVQHADGIDILLAPKPLTFSAAFFEPEAFHKLIRRGFQTYYGDDGAPPDSAAALYSARYDPEQRLAMRKALTAAITAYTLA
jgi:hypothetical protein